MNGLMVCKNHKKSYVMGVNSEITAENSVTRPLKLKKSLKFEFWLLQKKR